LGLSRFARGIGVFASKARFGPVPLPLGFNGGCDLGVEEGVGDKWARSWSGSAEPCLRSLRRLWNWDFRALREGWGFASKARSGPVPLLLGFNRGL
jgi:hypothetical protein